MVSLNAQSFFIDVCVATPTAVPYLEAGSAESPGIACKLRSADKTRQWKRSMTDLATVRSFVPFVVEATGRLGTQARRFLEGLRTPTSTPADSEHIIQSRSHFKRELQTIIAKWNARMVRQLRSNCSLVHQQLPLVTSVQPSVPIHGGTSRLQAQRQQLFQRISRPPSGLLATSAPPSSNAAAPRNSSSPTARPAVASRRRSNVSSARTDSCAFPCCDACLAEFCNGCRRGFCQGHVRDHVCSTPATRFSTFNPRLVPFNIPAPSHAEVQPLPSLASLPLEDLFADVPEDDLDADIRADPRFQESQDAPHQPPQLSSPAGPDAESPSTNFYLDQPPSPPQLPGSPSSLARNRAAYPEC